MLIDVRQKLLMRLNSPEAADVGRGIVSGAKFTSSGRQAISRNFSSDFFSLLVRSPPVVVKNEKLPAAALSDVSWCEISTPGSALRWGDLQFSRGRYQSARKEIIHDYLIICS